MIYANEIPIYLRVNVSHVESSFPFSNDILDVSKVANKWYVFPLMRRIHYFFSQKFVCAVCYLCFIKVCLTQSADLSVFVLFFLFFYYSFLFFSTATCVLWFLRHFSTNLDEIWQVDSPWWDEQTEYFFKSIGPGVGIRRGPKVFLCFIIGKTLYTVRRDKNFT